MHQTTTCHCRSSPAKFRDIFSIWLLFASLTTKAFAAEIHVSPTGDDSNPGTAARPLASVTAAQQMARPFAGHEPVTVWLHAGVYYLLEPIRFTAADSGTEKYPVVYAAAPGETPVISGGQKLKLDWKPLRDGIFQAQTTPGLVMDQLFVNGARQPRWHPAGSSAGGSGHRSALCRWSSPADGAVSELRSQCADL